ncbi:MAG: M24 family metallopeptidase [Pedobacter sp.]|nr:MAG: M24 family metallopeptidase [Pedobacter sp.]
MKKISFLCLLLLATLSSIAQKDLPKDYLSKAFHAGRRDALRAIMPANSVAIVFANPLRNFSNDVDFQFHQNPNLYYLTGYNEPDAVLFVFKEAQTDAQGNSYKELFFVQERNAQAESWTGRRLGIEGVQQQLGIPMALNGSSFKDFAIDISKFSQVLYELPVDFPISNTESARMGGLLASFAKKTNLRANPQPDNLKNGTRQFSQLMAQLREIKTSEELVLLRKAIEISCQGQIEVMKLAKPEMSEMEIRGLHEYVHKKYGAEQVGYGSIIGAGENGCILHYVDNTRTQVGNNLILMDVGAEYHGYTADVTRTIPASGKFSENEKLIYQIVYDAQEAAFKTMKPGSSGMAASNAASEVIAEGLLKLGIIKDKKDTRKYYTHGLSHHVGLDVHDPSSSRVYKENMLVTIEPGIYIPPGADCDEKWWGIAVRIEDDILITKTGYENLSVMAPRTIADIEKMMSTKSGLAEWKLPALPSFKKN